MAQTSVRQWSLGETTPSRANILAIAKKTGYLSGYLEDGKQPKKAPAIGDPHDPTSQELIEVWAQLNLVNRGRVLERAGELLAKQFPDAGDSRELQRRGN